MNFQYSNIELWRKKAKGSISTMISTLLIFVVSLYAADRVQEFTFYTGVLFFGIGLFQMIHFLRMPERDYIRFEEGYIDIRRGIADPRLKLPYEEVDRVQQINGEVISIRTSEGEGEDIYLENLAEEDVRSLLYELENRFGLQRNRK